MICCEAKGKLNITHCSLTNYYLWLNKKKSRKYVKNYLYRIKVSQTSTFSVATLLGYNCKLSYITNNELVVFKLEDIKIERCSLQLK